MAGKIVAYDPYLDAQGGGSIPGTELLSLDDLLLRSDFVSLHVPLTDGTRNLISWERIEKMKRGARLLNVARGGIVDEEAVQHARSEPHGGHRGLDRRLVAGATLHRERVNITEQDTTFRFTVDQIPGQAGIDPFLKQQQRRPPRSSPVPKPDRNPDVPNLHVPSPDRNPANPAVPALVPAVRAIPDRRGPRANPGSR